MRGLKCKGGESPSEDVPRPASSYVHVHAGLLVEHPAFMPFLSALLNEYKSREIRGAYFMSSYSC